MRRVALCVAAALLALPAPVAAQRARVQLLAVNDFHGHLEGGTPGTVAERAGGTPVAAGGAAHVAAVVRRLARRRPRRTLILSAGDLVGASPLVSALFHDEPTVRAWNRIGLDIAAVGNHELDEGLRELRRLQRGGCHPRDGCAGGAFRGARFRFLAANVVRARTGEPVFPPFAIRRLGGVDVGFVGLTLQGTSRLVSVPFMRGLAVRDEAQTLNRVARRLRRRHGVRAIVAVVHEGGMQAAPSDADGCRGLSGAISGIVRRTTRAVDLFVTGHTHEPYVCVLDGRPVTSAASHGRMVTDLDLTLDRRTRDIVRVRADNVIVRQTHRARDVARLVRRFRRLAAPRARRTVGVLAGPAPRVRDDAGESAAGNLVADSLLAAADGADAALMNRLGVRRGFPAGAVSFRAAFAVEPFGLPLVTMSLSGAQLLELLKQQWCSQSAPRVLQPSAGFRYAYSAGAAAAITGRRCASAVNPVVALEVAGAAVVATQRYRIAVNGFLAGGRTFPVLGKGTERVIGPLDLDALEAYLRPSLAGAPVAVPATDRIAVVP